MSTQPEQTIPTQAIVTGSVTVFVKYRDPSTPGEEVTVRLVAVDEWWRYIEVIGEIEQFVEFVTGRSAGWAKTLDDESLYGIDDKGKELNDPRFDRFVERQVKTVGQFKPMMSKLSGLKNSLPTQ